MYEIRDILDEYDHPNQKTKREIIKHLFDDPRRRHTAESILEDLDLDVDIDTVRNNLQDLKDDDVLEREQRAEYSWSGKGRVIRSYRDIPRMLHKLSLPSFTNLGTLFGPVLFVGGWLLISSVSMTLLTLAYYTPGTLILGIHPRTLYLLSGMGILAFVIFLCLVPMAMVLDYIGDKILAEYYERRYEPDSET